MNALNYDLYENDFIEKTQIQTHAAKPFVKWAGGKRALLEILRSSMPREFNNYFEPFLGGGALFFHLANEGILQGKKVYLNDKNAELINTYKVIQRTPKELLKELNSMQKAHNKEYFYSVRALDRDEKFATLSPIFRAARFIYLNKTCFNGLCRYNAKRQFNAPMGSYKNPKIYDETLILNAHYALQNAVILNEDFEFVRNLAQKGDFVYFDPPYFPLSPTASFTSYTDTFLDDEQTRLCELFKDLNSRGIKLLQSNSNTAFIKNLYQNFSIQSVQAKRAINCKGYKRGKVSELTIRSFDE